jgi:hypothetical protein
MNRQSLKQAQTCIDELIAAVRCQQTLEKPAPLVALEMWLSSLDIVRSELIEFETSITPSFTLDMRGVLYGTTGE